MTRYILPGILGLAIGAAVAPVIIKALGNVAHTILEHQE